MESFLGAKTPKDFATATTNFLDYWKAADRELDIVELIADNKTVWRYNDVFYALALKERAISVGTETRRALALSAARTIGRCKDRVEADQRLADVADEALFEELLEAGIENERLMFEDRELSIFAGRLPLPARLMLDPGASLDDGSGSANLQRMLD